MADSATPTAADRDNNLFIGSKSMFCFFGFTGAFDPFWSNSTTQGGNR